MRIPSWLVDAFNLRQGEEGLTAILLLHSFSLGVSLVFFETAASTIFLTTFDVVQLPWVYVGAAVMVTMAGALYAKLEEQLAVSTLLVANLVFLLLSIGAFRVALTITDTKWLAMALLGWSVMLAVLTSLEFWGLAGRLMNVRQGKRLFGLIGSGEEVAGILAGLLIPLLVGPLGVQNLLFCALAGMAGSVGALFYITWKWAAQLAIDDDEEKETSGAHPLTELLKDRYLLLIFALSALSVIGYYFVDFAFYERIEVRYVDEAALASFLGIFAAVVGGVNLLSRTLVSGRLLTRFGLSVGLVALPLMVAAGSLASAVTGSIVAGSMGGLGLFFWLIVATKLFDEVLRASIDEPSVLILYQPLPADRRLRTQTMIESLIEPVAGGIAGVALILLTSIFTFQAVHAVYIMLGVLAVWLVVAVALRREYTVALTQALAKRTLGGGMLSLQDGSSLAVLNEGLKSPHAGEVIYSLHMLEDIGHSSLERFLTLLLDHVSPDVRLEALRRLERVGTEASRRAVEQLIGVEQEPHVKGAALRTLCALDETDGFTHVITHLDDAEPLIRQGVMVGLLRSGGIEGVLAAGERLTALVHSQEPNEREIAAHVLGEVGIRNFFRPVLELLRDDDQDVRQAALTAAGKLKNPRLWPLVLENLAAPAVRSTAALALIAGGDEALPEMEAAFDASEHDDRFRIRIARICGRIGGERAVCMLKTRMTFPRMNVRQQILVSLSACRYRAVGQEAETVHDLLEKEGYAAAWITSALVDMGSDEISMRVRQALVQEQRENLERIFLLLSFIYQAQPILRARDNFAGDSLEKKAYAIDVIDNLVAPDLKAFILPLLEEIPEEQRMRQLMESFPEERLGRDHRLEDIIRQPRAWTSAWTRATAVYTVGQLAASEFNEAIATALSASSPLVRETAAWAMGRLHPDDLTERLRVLTRDPVPRVREVARFVMDAMGRGVGSVPSQYLTRSGRSEEALFAYLLLDTQESRWRRCRAARYLARSRGHTARDALMAGVDIADETIRTAVLEALHVGRFDVSDDEKRVLFGQLRAEMRDVERTIATIELLRHQDGFARLVEALHHELTRNRERILLILTLCGEPCVYDTLHYWYILQDCVPPPAPVCNVLHTVLSQVIDEELRARVVTLFQHGQLAALIEAWRPLVEQTSEARHTALESVAFAEARWVRPWTRVCALEKIVDIRPHGCEQRLVQALTDPDELVREVAVWAFWQIDADAFAQRALALQADPSPRVARLIRQLEREYNHALDTGEGRHPQVS